MMTIREKAAHLHRRFGFGATVAELNEAERVGLDATLKRLIDFETVPDSSRLSPHEFTWREKEEPDLGAYRYRLWWVLKMITTTRPLQEKLTLFWHSHFAVSDSKVEDGPMMLQYLQTLRQHAAGKFPILLEAVSKDPAMMRYLDMQRSIRGNPNENFAREVMELFTLGIGNYTERDVQEAARAFTGWGYVNLFYEMPGNNEQRLRDSIKYDRPFSAFTPMATMHDPSPKTLFGKVAAYDGDDVLEILAKRPETARRIARRLWEFFAYDDPTDATIEPVAKAFMRSGGDTREALRTMAKSPDFWSDHCIRKHVKSPVDFCIGVARQMEIGPALMALRGNDANPTTRIPQKVLDNMWYVTDRIQKAGLNLLYPDDVSGWKWGKAWISPAAMVERYQYRGMLIWAPKGADTGAHNVISALRDRKPKDTTEMAAALAAIFDVQLDKDALGVVAKAFEKTGGVEALKHEDWWGGVFDNAMKVLVAAPQMHVC